MLSSGGIGLEAIYDNNISLLMLLYKMLRFTDRICNLAMPRMPLLCCNDSDLKEGPLKADHIMIFLIPQDHLQPQKYSSFRHLDWGSTRMQLLVLASVPKDLYLKVLLTNDDVYQYTKRALEVIGFLISQEISNDYYCHDENHDVEDFKIQVHCLI